MRRPLSVILVVLLVGGLPGCGRTGNGTIVAGGATFVDPIMQTWATEYSASTGVFVDYTAKGSGYGVSQVIGRSVAFGCSDAPMNRKDLNAAREAGGEVIHVPLTIGAIAVIYNLPGVAELKLSGPVLADIYLRNVRNWSDKAIADLNPGAALPDLAIVPVFRAEDSGTTYTFTDYLAKVSPAFAKYPGVGKKPKWPAGGTGQQGSGGVANHVKENAGSIGYVENSFAHTNDLTVAALKNRAGAFVRPEPATVTAAAAGAATTKPTTEPHSLHELTFTLTDTAGEKAYPIVGVNYAMAFTRPPADKGGAAVPAFLTWVVTDGQKLAGELGYAPLPDDLQKKCVALIAKIGAK